MRKVLLLIAGCAVLAACGGTAPTAPTAVARLSRTRFLAFGDSLTSGEVTAPLGHILIPSGVALVPSQRLIVVPSAAYPSVLQGQLQARYVAQTSSISVINAGKGGESLVDGAVRIREAMSENRPEVVLLMEGVNGLPIMGPDFSAELTREMVQTAKAQGARVFLASMLPTIPGRQRSQPVGDLVAFDLRLEQLAFQEGAVFVDLYNRLQPEVASVIGIDGLHPTEAGYRRIADIFFAAIQANLEVKP